MIFLENFGRAGGGVISDLKHFIANFFGSETAVLVVNFRKNLERGGGGFRSEKFHCKFVAHATDLSKLSEKIAIYFLKKGRGFKGRSKIF